MLGARQLNAAAMRAGHLLVLIRHFTQESRECSAAAGAQEVHFVRFRVRVRSVHEVNFMSRMVFRLGHNLVPLDMLCGTVPCLGYG